MASDLTQIVGAASATLGDRRAGTPPQTQQPGTTPQSSGQEVQASRALADASIGSTRKSDKERPVQVPEKRTEAGFAGDDKPAQEDEHHRGDKRKLRAVA